jgi:hypothetical protein
MGLVGIRGMGRRRSRGGRTKEGRLSRREEEGGLRR